MLLIAWAAMSLFSVVIMAIYAALEEDQKRKEIRKYVRKQIMKQMEFEKQMAVKMKESAEMFSDRYK